MQEYLVSVGLVCTRGPLVSRVFVGSAVQVGGAESYGGVALLGFVAPPNPSGGRGCNTSPAMYLLYLCMSDTKYQAVSVNKLLRTFSAGVFTVGSASTSTFPDALYPCCFNCSALVVAAIIIVVLPLRPPLPFLQDGECVYYSTANGPGLGRCCVELQACLSGWRESEGCSSPGQSLDSF